MANTTVLVYESTGNNVVPVIEVLVTNVNHYVPVHVVSKQIGAVPVRFVLDAAAEKNNMVPVVSV